MEDELEQLTADYLSSVLGFNGERIDPVLGGYHLGNGYRLYSPSLRRFTSPDSMSPFGQGGINPYAYCEGDPINNTDPSGHLGIFGTFLMVVTALTPGGEETEATEMMFRDAFDMIADDNKRRDEHLATRSLKDAASKAIAPEDRPSTSRMRTHSPATALHPVDRELNSYLNEVGSQWGDAERTLFNGIDAEPTWGVRPGNSSSILGSRVPLSDDRPPEGKIEKYFDLDGRLRKYENNGDRYRVAKVRTTSLKGPVRLEKPDDPMFARTPLAIALSDAGWARVDSIGGSIAHIDVFDLDNDPHVFYRWPAF